jgi:integrase
MTDVDDLWFEEDPDNPDGGKRPSPKHGTGKRYQARWRDPAGTQRKKRFRTKREAEQHLVQVESSKAAGSYVDANAGRVTFAEYAEQWRKSRTHDVATATRIETCFRVHAYQDPKARGRTPGGGPSIGQHQMGMLSRSPSVMQGWIAGIPLAASSARLVIGDVSQVFTAAIEDGVIARNPLRARSIQRPRADKKEAAALTVRQAVAVISGLPERDWAMAEMAEGCGHRQGEAFAVAVDDIDFLRKTVRIDTQVKNVAGQLHFAPLKNHKPRVVPVADPLVFTLSEHIRRFPLIAVTLPWWDTTDRQRHLKPVTRRLLFTRIDGRAHMRSEFNPRWRRALLKAGLPAGQQTYGFHVLRHTFASRLLSNGVGLAKVAALMGDTKEVVLAVYAHFMPDDDDQVRSVMNSYFAGRGETPEVPAADDVP